MEHIEVTRYPSEFGVRSDLHKMDDVLDLLSFLKAEDYVASELVNRHAKSKSSALKLSKRISAHAELAKQYANLSLKSSDEISFLPGYYCILNLAKCVSLCGPYSSQFDHHSRWHGATYNGKDKMSHSVLTDQIRIRGGGALALFYKTLTGTPITGDKMLKIRDFYYLIPGIGSELSIATSVGKTTWYIKFTAEKKSGKIIVIASVHNSLELSQMYPGSVRSLPALKGFKKKPNSVGVFSKSFQSTAGRSLYEELRDNIDPTYLMHDGFNQKSICFEQNSSLHMTEEFATALAFYHLSSVCRYNPEFMAKLGNSKEWPMLLALRRQGLYYFIISIWSYFIQQNYVLS